MGSPLHQVGLVSPSTISALSFVKTLGTTSVICGCNREQDVAPGARSYYFKFLLKAGNHDFWF